MSKRKIQIGVMGSAADLNYSDSLKDLAYDVGREIARHGAVCIFGAEKDYDSLSTVSGRGARSAGGLTIGMTYGKGLEVYDDADVVIATGLERGGGREFPLVLSCDGIITISGGSGMLTEMLVAYQADIPIVALRHSGGWSEKLIGTYLDERKRLEVIGADTAEQAVSLVLQTISLKRSRL